jgi:hypothetical protein
VLLSISVSVSVSIAEPGIQPAPTAIKRSFKEWAKDQWKRQSTQNETAELDELNGFFSNDTIDHPDACSSAVVFRLSGGRLEDDNGFLGVDPGVDYINLVGERGGLITRTFDIENEILTWRNESFSGGRAGFCQTSNGEVFATFAQNAGPVNCTSIDIIVYEAGQCQNGVIVPTATSSSTIALVTAITTGPVAGFFTVDGTVTETVVPVTVFGVSTH